MPLFDAYAGPVRDRALEDDRLHPALKTRDDLPTNVLFIVASIDIVAHEQLTFIERVRNELQERGGHSRRFESVVFDNGFHGWIDCRFVLIEVYHHSPLTV